MESSYLQVLTILTYVVLVANLVPFLILVPGFSRHRREIRWLTAFLALSFFTDLTSAIFYDLLEINPNYINHLFRLFGIALISPFFYYAVGWRRIKKPLIFVNLIYLVFVVTNLLYIQKIGEINTYTQALLSLIILALCITFFYKLLKELPAQQIHKLALFWIVSGFFLSYAGKFVIYTVTQYMTEIQGDKLEVVWIFHNILTLIGYSLITIGVYINRRSESLTTSAF